jgi:hypothetical protein
MSQQHEMEFTEAQRDRPADSYDGYRSSSYQEEFAPNAYKANQETPLYVPRASHYDDGINPTFMMQMRLGLIIVSLILWVIVFFGSIWAITRIPAGLAFVLYPVIFLGLGVFTLLVALSNLLFRRR